MILSNKERIEILKNWNIGDIKHIEKAKLGLVNHNWLIQTDKGKFVLRSVFKERRFEEINFEIEYLLRLQEKLPYKIPSPIAKKDKRYILTIGDNNLWLYKFIEGDVLLEFDEEMLKKTAEMIADYHNALEIIKLDNKKGKSNPLSNESLSNETENNLKSIKNKKIKSKADKVYLKEFKELTNLIKNLNQKDYNTLKQYPIHRDLGPENILWKNKSISGIIDFENVGLSNDILVKDLAIFMQRTLASNAGILNLKKAGYLVREYKKLRPLSDKEIGLIPDLIIASYIDDANYAHWLINNEPKRCKIKHITENAAGAKWFFNNRSKIAKELK